MNKQEKKIEQLRTQLFTNFEEVINDSKAIRELLKKPEEITVDLHNVIKTRVGNNKVINGACNGILTTIRLTNNIDEER